LRKLALSVYDGLQHKIAKLRPLKTRYEELFSLIDVTCMQWLFINPPQSMHVVVTWQGMKDAVWPDTNHPNKDSVQTKSKTEKRKHDQYR
jgi:hypothetical protein